MKKDYTVWIVAAAVIGAFMVLICAWIFFFWIAANNRVADVPLESQGGGRSAATQSALPQAEMPAAAEGKPAQ